MHRFDFKNPIQKNNGDVKLIGHGCTDWWDNDFIFATNTPVSKHWGDKGNIHTISFYNYVYERYMNQNGDYENNNTIISSDLFVGKATTEWAPGPNNNGMVEVLHYSGTVQEWPNPAFWEQLREAIDE